MHFQMFVPKGKKTILIQFSTNTLKCPCAYLHAEQRTVAEEIPLINGIGEAHRSGTAVEYTTYDPASCPSAEAKLILTQAQGPTKPAQPCRGSQLKGANFFISERTPK